MARIELSTRGLREAQGRLEEAQRDVDIHTDNLTYAQSKLDAILDERRKRNGG